MNYFVEINFVTNIRCIYLGSYPALVSYTPHVAIQRVPYN